MKGMSRLQSLFDSIDNLDVDKFLTFLSEDVRFRFGNAKVVEGKTAVGEGTFSCQPEDGGVELTTR